MASILLSRAPVIYAAHTFGDEVLQDIVKKSQIFSDYYDITHKGNFCIVPEIDFSTRVVTLNRLNPYGAAIEIDLSQGTASFWKIRANVRKISWQKVAENTVPYLLRKLPQRADYDKRLVAALYDFWNICVLAFIGAHKAEKREVDIRGWPVGEFEPRVLGPEIWNFKPDWVNGCIIPPTASSDEAASSNQVRGWRRLHVTYLGERVVEPKVASAARKRVVYDNLVARTEGRLPMGTREIILKAERLLDPALKDTEFDEVWKAVKALGAPKNGTELGKPGRPRGAKVRRG